MIPRYSRYKMSNMWSEHEKFQSWLEIEILVCEAQEASGLVPEGVTSEIRDKAKFDIERIDILEQVTHHDVTAFLKNVYEYTGENGEIYLHNGITSADLVDTSFTLRIKRASELLFESIDNLLQTLQTKAFEYKNMVCVGRTHGIHADPLTYGMKFARFYAEMKRNKKRLIDAITGMSVCKISGSTGGFVNVDWTVEEYVANALGLTPETIGTQVIPRDRHAHMFSIFAIIATSIENIALEIRGLQRTEVGEVNEFFQQGQTGSSSMPHKKNPVLSENLTGLARLMRSYVDPALQNIPLWHERDISHSSVERCIIPDAFITLDFMLHRVDNILTNLIINENKVTKNLSLLNDLIFSQRVLLELIKKQVNRTDAYEMVQSISFTTMLDNISFKDALLNDDRIVQILGNEKIISLFDFDYFLQHIDKIFDRVFTDDY